MKKNLLICVCTGICVILIVFALIISRDKDKPETESMSLVKQEEAIKDIPSDKTDKYDNLIFTDFYASTEEIEGVYTIEILSDNSYMDKTFLENFAAMNDVIDKFFMEDFDKSSLVVDFYFPDSETVYVKYDDIATECADEKYNMPRAEFLFGNETSNGGYMVQITEALNNVWFSRYGLGDIHPTEYKKVYPYISCIRQIEDVEINLKDGRIKLSELEKQVLNYLNESFPIPHDDKITFGIGDVRILDNGEYDGVCFKVRRIYKGIPFEYGSNASQDMYNDEFSHDSGEIDYAVSTYPDTMLSFGCMTGTVVETDTITEMIPAEEALYLLSENIGNNSVYEVQGIELVYRNCEVPKERLEEVDAILRPCWKIITINQSDDKYTLFYVDVVTGDITNRFEYYYE
ncbi:MAG: hypothetical protein ACI4EN_07890 [Butyrivibrio sp.]